MRKDRLRDRAYQSWRLMKRRCLDEKDISYHRYGGRGISICKDWALSFESFYKDMGNPPDKYTLDRIDNNKDYSPSNCKWSSRKHQARNRGTYNKFNEDTVKIARHLYKRGFKTSQIAKKFLK